MTDSDTQTPLTPPRRRNRRPQQQSTVPVVFQPKFLLVVAVLVALVWLGFAGFEAWRNSYAHIKVSALDNAPISDVHIEFFENDQASTGASPPAKIGEMDSKTVDFSVGQELVPGAALVRVSAAGFGATYGLMECGRAALKVRLAKALTRRGRVMFRDEGRSQPIEGARVQAFGGGARGVLLGEVKSGADGTFTLEGVSQDVPFLTYRVFAKGYGVYEKEEHGSIEELKTFRLSPTRPVTGRVITPEDYDAAGLELRIFRLPGVVTTVSEDETFRFENVPPSPMRCTIVAPDLPEGLTFRKSVVRAGDDDFELRIERAGRLRGFAVDRESRQPIEGTKVFHSHGPNGLEVVTCGKYGDFDLGRVPEGSVRITADVLVRVLELQDGRPKRMRKVRQGIVDVETNAAEVIDEIVVPID